MTLTELLNTKEGEKLICIIPTNFFTVGKAYTVYESPVGRTVQNNNGVNKFMFDMMDNFEKV